VRILSVSGSLRSGSSNAAILHAAATVAPAGVHVEHHERLGELPYFNPDLDVEGAIPPPPVAALRASLAAADAILICSPEYAHGVPGVLKNALDWLVSDGKLVGKAVAVMTAGPSGGGHAHAQLVETLATMSWRVVVSACLRLALGRAQLGERGELRDAALRERLRGAVAALVASTS
jgi:chromate reductase, NAD(P)H dehydrogenase (quinone)